MGHCQQPGGGDTAGVAAAPLALAGAIIVGLVRSSETLSLHAAEFGVGMTLKAGLMLVPPVSMTGGCIAPACGLAGMSGVTGGSVAALVSALPGADVQELL